MLLYIIILIYLGVAVIALTRPETALLILMTWIFIQDGITIQENPVYSLFDYSFLPDVFEYFDEFLLVLMLIRVLWSKYYRVPKKNRISDPILLPLFLYLGVGVFSMLINEVNPVIALFGLRANLQMMMLFYVVILYDWKETALERVWKLIWFLMSVNLIIIILSQINSYFFGGIEDISGTLWIFDFANGIYGHGKHYILATISGMLILLTLVEAQSNPERKITSRLYMLFYLFLIPSFRTAFIALPLAAFLIYKNPFKLLRKFTVPVLLIIILVPLLGSNLSEEFDIFTNVKAQDEAGSMRLTVMAYGLQEIISNNSYLFGVGPGMWGSSASTFFGIRDIYEEVSELGGYLAGMPAWVPIYTETGFIGLLFFLFILWRCYFFSSKYRDRSETTNIKYLRALPAVVLFLFLLAINFTIFESQQIMGLFWFLVGYLYREISKVLVENTTPTI